MERGACAWLCGALLRALGGCAAGACLCCSSCIDTETGATDALLCGALAPQTTLGGFDGTASAPCRPCSS